MALQYYQQKELPPYQADGRNDPYKYKPSDALIDACNVALSLHMPLLITGEPGSGKTQFAHHLAAHFGLPIEVFNAKTTSAAADLFYRYQAVKHFQYIQNIRQQQEEGQKPKSTEDFIEYTALGKAIKTAEEEKLRSVVLIDEIDKAPRDFPNDILNELENLAFHVPELDRSFQAPKDLKPIVVLTSNSEKNLPAPFLRRCVYVNIDFPNENELYDIVAIKLQADSSEETELRSWIQEFNAIRKLAEEANTKKPATAELISWLLVLRQLGFPVSSLGKADADKALLFQSYTVIAKSEELRTKLEERVKNWT